MSSVHGAVVDVAPGACAARGSVVGDCVAGGFVAGDCAAGGFPVDAGAAGGVCAQLPQANEKITAVVATPLMTKRGPCL